MTQNSISFLGSSSRGGLARSLFTEYGPMEWWNYWIPMAKTPLESMDIVSSHSWSHSNQKRRKSASLSHKKPKQRRVWWTWFYHSPKFFVNFVNFKVFSILLILVFDLKSCFYVCFNLFEWSQVEEIARKLKEKKSERNRSKNKAKTTIDLST